MKNCPDDGGSKHLWNVGKHLKSLILFMKDKSCYGKQRR
jgi:hypothetical protein